MLRLEIGELERAAFNIDLTGFHASELVLDEIDYSFLDDADDIESALDDMMSNVKKAIQIEFEPEDYEEAQQLVKWWRDRKARLGRMIIGFLKQAKEKA